MIHKYGLPLTDSDWSGLPMRVGHFPSAGRIEDLSTASDAVLLWTGATSHVEIAFRDGGGAIRERRFERASGMIDILPRSVVLEQVRWKNDGLGSNCVSVNFPAGSLAQLLGEGDKAPLEHVGPRFALSDQHAADLITRLQAQVVSGNPLGAAYSQGLSLTLVSYLFASYAPGVRPSADIAVEPGRLPRLQCEALMVFVEDFLSRNIGLVDMAAVVGYSPDHFSRLFRQTFRISPYRYLVSRRVERAKAMLRDAALPIAEIALACGFSSQSHLSSVFKRMTGVTPARYRRG
ncbi:MAG TPA: helix-turn-helix transcriptional regulator [Polyangia bacterium]|nr:helix-turn-helix transcriptional regulator [Polyangia bacterium]